MKKENLLLIFALICVFILVYSPHFLNQYPFHVDEWHHIEYGLKIGTGAPMDYMEIGFDFFIYIISKFTNIIKIYQILPAISAVLTSFILFYYLRGKSLASAFIAIGLFTLLPSNVNLLGIWFFVPMTMAIPLFYLSLFMFEKALKEEDKKKLITSLILTIITFIIHPPTALVMMVAEFFLALKEKKLFKRKKDLLYLLILLFPFLLYLKIFWKGNFIKTIRFFFQYLYFTKEFSAYHFSMNPILLYGIFPFILAIIELVKIFKTKRFQIFKFIFILSSINLIIFAFFEITFIAHYQRVLYHFMLAAIPLSALGFLSIYNLIKKSIDKKSLKITLLIILILLTIMPNLLGYYNVHEEGILYQVTRPSEIPALNFITTLPEGKILTPPKIGNVLYPITKRNPITSLYWHGPNRYEEVKKFYNQSCEYGLNLTKKYSVKYVLSFKQNNCSFLTNIYQDNVSYVYSINEKFID